MRPSHPPVDQPKRVDTEFARKELRFSKDRTDLKYRERNDKRPTQPMETMMQHRESAHDPEDKLSASDHLVKAF